MRRNRRQLRSYLSYFCLETYHDLYLQVQTDVSFKTWNIWLKFYRSHCFNKIWWQRVGSPHILVSSIVPTTDIKITFYIILNVLIKLYLSHQYSSNVMCYLKWRSLCFHCWDFISDSVPSSSVCECKTVWFTWAFAESHVKLIYFCTWSIWPFPLKISYSSSHYSFERETISERSAK